MAAYINKHSVAIMPGTQGCVWHCKHPGCPAMGSASDEYRAAEYANQHLKNVKAPLSSFVHAPKFLPIHAITTADYEVSCSCGEWLIETDTKGHGQSLWIIHAYGESNDLFDDQVFDALINEGWAQKAGKANKTQTRWGA